MAPPKRKRQDSPKGLAAAQVLKRTRLAEATAWGWVGSEVLDVADITSVHRRTACGFSQKVDHPFCENKFSHTSRTKIKPLPEEQNPSDDIIVISDSDNEPECSRKRCKTNPNCLNYLGQGRWNKSGEAKTAFLKKCNLGHDPALHNREPGLPVGLENLGATCYANASLQVWFRNKVFRHGVYACQTNSSKASNHLCVHRITDLAQDSPIFQLQVTFAGLQELTQNVFNPTDLVESLQLRTFEQQDAQEFSKLFMSHLDTEFKKQKDPRLRSLVTDQFRGQQLYGTECSRCHYRSEREADFLEIEVSIENNSSIEDRIAKTLETEYLSGDNRYHCPQCGGLQDATRYTELRGLPPVLNLSMLRFVYDTRTYERKKCKHVISFPTVLDMTRFLKYGSDGSNVYELRGVLLHKGASAHHGHYEAQVFDTDTASWYQFNDEYVTKLRKLPSLKTQTTDVEITDDHDTKSSGKGKVTSVRKRQRVEDSDDENIVSSRFPTLNGDNNDSIRRIITSKDAYMLVYSRRTNATVIIEQSPPKLALDVVHALNDAHAHACKEYKEKEAKALEDFKQLKQRVLDVVQTWHITSHAEESVVVSRQALEAWVEEPQTESISVNDILCTHGRLDPAKASDMKRIKKSAYIKIHDELNCKFFPELNPDDACQECVAATFEGMLNDHHPQWVRSLEDVIDEDVEFKGYWISKAWLKGSFRADCVPWSPTSLTDWRLAKPKMHVPSKNDPSPDSEEYGHHVRCGHGALSLNISNRRKISKEAYSLLHILFPTWETLSSDDELCAVCEEALHSSRENNIQLRRMAEEEKACLKQMQEYTSDESLRGLYNTPMALIPDAFVRGWRRWIAHPTNVPRPEGINTEMFFCNHDLLVFDPSRSVDMTGAIAFVKKADWDVLATFYTAGRPVYVERLHLASDPPESRLLHSVPVCEECRLRRRTDWQETEITVRLRGRNTSSSHSSSQPSGAGSADGPSDIRTFMNDGRRKSKRLRESRGQVRERCIRITKDMTVKDIKIMLQDQFDMPTICQRLFHNDIELADNSHTVELLKILANDTLELLSEPELHEISDTEEPPRKKQHEEERGFGGTLLGGSARSSSPLAGHRLNLRRRRRVHNARF
ncbi:cysteine proteinase [Fistulina hepatica ATCC 64428]|nr:cysteine proteinase [Fistulina hepatica ATCC 64428]